MPSNDRLSAPIAAQLSWQGQRLFIQARLVFPLSNQVRQAPSAFNENFSRRATLHHAMAQAGRSVHPVLPTLPTLPDRNRAFDALQHAPQAIPAPGSQRSVGLHES